MSPGSAVLERLVDCWASAIAGSSAKPWLAAAAAERRLLLEATRAAGR